MTDDYVAPDPGHRAAILSALTRGIARDVDRLPLAARLCRAYLEVLGGVGAAITVGYHQPDRLTLRDRLDHRAPRRPPGGPGRGPGMGCLLEQAGRLGRPAPPHAVGALRGHRPRGARIPVGLCGTDALFTDDAGPWVVRQRVHQAVGMVVSQLDVAPLDAMAVVRAHAYAQDTTVESIATLVLDRSIDFSASGPTTKDPS